MAEVHINDQIRYLHFHDYYNSILFIGTFSGTVYSWSHVGIHPESKPKKLVNLSRTVTSIRNSRGVVRINPITTITRHYVIFGTIKGQLSLYSHDENLEDGTLNTKDLMLEWAIIAHEASKGPFDENFGSLCKMQNFNIM